MLDGIRPGLSHDTTPPAGGEGPALRHDPLHREAFQRPRWRFGMVPSLALALLLHVTIAMALVAGVTDEDKRLGAGGIDLEAVSVEVALVSASAIESRATSPSPEAASAAAIDQAEGAPVAAEAAPETKPVETETKAEPETRVEPEPLQVDKGETPPQEMPPLTTATNPTTLTTTADMAPPEPEAIVLPVREAAPPPVEPRPEAPVPSPASTSSPAIEAGGAASRADKGAERAARAAAVASPGAVRAFAKSVVDALGRTRPRGADLKLRGTAKVAFAVAEGGGIEFVRIAQSSGHDSLDNAAVAAVKRASFPAPPAGMTLRERTYEVPYHFR